MPSSSRKFDIADLFIRDNVSLSGGLEFKDVEAADERRSRLRREEAEASHRRRREMIILVAVVVVVGVAVALCLWVILGPGYSVENMKWATTMLTSIVSAAVGYATGKAGKAD